MEGERESRREGYRKRGVAQRAGTRERKKERERERERQKRKPWLLRASSNMLHSSSLGASDLTRTAPPVLERVSETRKSSSRNLQVGRLSY